MGGTALGDDGPNITGADDSEAQRKVQEMDLLRRGITVSESTRKQKLLRAKVGDRNKINVIEQNKMQAKIK